MSRRCHLLLFAALTTVVFAGACAAPATGPSPTRLDVTTNRTICGGTIPPPGQPFCRTSPSARTVEVRTGRTVVASGTTGSDGRALLDVPAGRLTVAVPEAAAYETCDAPVVDALGGQTVPVVQTCTIYAP